jgi:hypothetical protein
LVDKRNDFGTPEFIARIYSTFLRNEQPSAEHQRNRHPGTYSCLGLPSYPGLPKHNLAKSKNAIKLRKHFGTPEFISPDFLLDLFAERAAQVQSINAIGIPVSTAVSASIRAPKTQSRQVKKTPHNPENTILLSERLSSYYFRNA